MSFPPAPFGSQPVPYYPPQVREEDHTVRNNFLIGFVIIVVLTLIGVGIWQLYRSQQPGGTAAEVKKPVLEEEKVETDAEKKARLDKEAAAKAAALTTDTTSKEQAALDADVKAATDRLSNIAYEIVQAKDLFKSSASAATSPAAVAAKAKLDAAVTQYASTESESDRKAMDDADKAYKTSIAGSTSWQLQRERALNSAGWGTYLANAIEARAKVLKKDTDAAVVKAISDLRATSAATFTALNGDDTGAKIMRDANGCMQHITNNGKSIVCPDKFGTFYEYGVNSAADCPVADGSCNRCIGFEFPKPEGGRSGQWNNRKWDVHSGTSSGPLKPGDGKVMSYSGIYVVDGVPVGSQKCT